MVAFTDDDVIVDPAWLRRCAEAFERARDVACVTGLILPLELETDSQLLLEQFAGSAKAFGAEPIASARHGTEIRSLLAHARRDRLGREHRGARGRRPASSAGFDHQPRGRNAGGGRRGPRLLHPPPARGPRDRL